MSEYFAMTSRVSQVTHGDGRSACYTARVTFTGYIYRSENYKMTSARNSFLRLHYYSRPRESWQQGMTEAHERLDSANVGRAVGSIISCFSPSAAICNMKYSRRAQNTKNKKYDLTRIYFQF